jgi:hypothetical protein
MRSIGAAWSGGLGEQLVANFKVCTFDLDFCSGDEQQLVNDAIRCAETHFVSIEITVKVSWYCPRAAWTS